MKSIILIASVLFSLYGCGGDDTFKTTSLNFTEIGKGELYSTSYTNNGNSVNRVIDNLDEWQNLASTMVFNRTIIDDVPFKASVINFTEVDIDFSKYQIIAIFDCEEMPPSKTDIKTITEYENEIIVKYETVGSTAAVAFLGQSFHIVKMLSSKKPIKFQESTIKQITRCPK